MSQNRDDFSRTTKELLARKVAFRCSNPACKKLTYGATLDRRSSMNLGVAAHIRAAAPRGPRYCAAMTQDQRKDERNGIWLCQYCAKLIDSDVSAYTVELLESWKYHAEAETHRELENRELESRERIRRFDGILEDLPNYDRPESFLELAYQISTETDKLVEKLENIQHKLHEAQDVSDILWEQIYQAQFDTTMSLLMRMRAETDRIRSEAKLICTYVKESQCTSLDHVISSPGHSSNKNFYCEENSLSKLRTRVQNIVESLVHISLEADCTVRQLMEYDQDYRAKTLSLLIDLENTLYEK